MNELRTLNWQIIYLCLTSIMPNICLSVWPRNDSVHSLNIRCEFIVLNSSVEIKSNKIITLTKYCRPQCNSNLSILADILSGFHHHIPLICNYSFSFQVKKSFERICIPTPSWGQEVCNLERLVLPFAMKYIVKGMIFGNSES